MTVFFVSPYIGIKKPGADHATCLYW